MFEPRSQCHVCWWPLAIGIRAALTPAQGQAPCEGGRVGIHRWRNAHRLHQALFHIPTGKCLGPPADTDLVAFPVKVEGPDILVDL